MKKLFQKLVATIILIILLLSSSGQVIIYAYDEIMLASENAVGATASTTYRLYDRRTMYNATDKKSYIYYCNGTTVWDYSTGTISDVTKNRYCMMGEVHVNDQIPDSDGHWYANYTEKLNLLDGTVKYNTSEKVDNRTIGLFRNTSDLTRTQSLKAVKWLAYNTYTNTSSNTATERQIIKTYLNQVIAQFASTDNYKQQKIDNLDDGLIQVVQQYAFWHFTNVNGNDAEYHPTDESFIDNITSTKKTFTSAERTKAKALYTALINGATAYGQGKTKLTMDTNTYAIHVETTSDTKITQTTSTYYKFGPIKISIINESTGNTVTNKTVLTDITGKISNINAEISGYSKADGNGISLEDAVNNTDGVYVSFKTSDNIDGKNVKFTCTSNFVPRLTSCSAYVYMEDNHQPIVEINKKVAKNLSNGSVSAYFNKPEKVCDVALIKEIAQVYRYDESAGKWLRVYDSETTASTDTNTEDDKSSDIVYGKRLTSYAKDTSNTTDKYIMDKTPISVMPGDVIRYKLTVYNEGDLPVNIEKITDYAQTGLKPVLEQNTNYGKYNYKFRSRIEYDSSNNSLTMSPTPIGTVTAGNNNSIYFEFYVDIDNVEPGDILMNVAEITEYWVYDPSGVYSSVTDRDSTGSNVVSNIETYKKYVENNIKDISSVDERDLKEDDEDFEQIQIKTFDMAVRKSIASVTSDGTKTNINRTPSDYTYDDYETTYKIGYYHDKTPIKVKDGDTVLYTIRVYNEGYMDGYVSEITDYLPAGLVYKTDSTVNSRYNWKATENSDGTTVVTTDYLYNTKIPAANGSEGFKTLKEDPSYYYGKHPEEKFWVDVQIECTVDASKSNNKTILTNMVELTKYGYYARQFLGTTTSGKDVFCDAEGIDSDSEQDNLLDKLQDVGKAKTGEGYYDVQKATMSSGTNYYYGLQDDDDFENIEIERFDLALRKFITQVDDEKIEGDDSREPKINRDSITELINEGTAIYYHRKEPITVKAESTVVYTIRVYNEGDIDGIAREITDYLPSSLEFIDPLESSINKDYGWVATKNDNGTTTITTDYLKNTTIKASSGSTGYEKWLKNTLTDDEQFWADVLVECKVKSNINDTIITNVAEITNYGYGDYHAEEEGKVDTDSVENNVISGKISDGWIDMYRANRYTGNVSIENNPSYSGFEDDDDFENLKVDAKFSYNLVLKKTDEEGAEINGAIFSVTKYEAENNTTSESSNAENIGGLFYPLTTEAIFNGEISGSETINVENLIALKNYFYQIKEEASADGYLNLLEGYTIIVPTYFDKDAKLNIGVTNIEAHEYYQTYGFVILKDDNTILEDTNDLYNKVSVSINTETETPQILVTVQNKKVNGSYNFRVKKVDEDGKTIADMTFNYSRIESITESNGTITTKDPEIKKLVTAKGYGYKTVTGIKINGEGTDKFEITEVINDNNSYIELADKLTIIVTKELDGDTYKITKVAFEGGTEEGTTAKTNALLSDGTSVEVEAKLSGTLVTLTVPNKKITGSYGMQIVKTGEDSETKLSGVKFNVTDESGNTVGTDLVSDDNGIVNVISNKTIEKIGVDKYTITELDLGENAYVPLLETIDIYVETKIENYQYKATRASFNEITDEAETTNEIQVTLENGNSVPAQITVGEDGIVTVTLANEKVKGNYVLKIKKVINGTSTPIQGVKFTVKEGEEVITPAPYATNIYGRTIIKTKEITEDTVGIEDVYTITEINLNDKPYIKLKDAITVYINKSRVGNEYKVTSVSFTSGKKDSTEDTIEAELEDGTKVNVVVSIVDGIVVVKIPNEPITGQYSLELLKTGENDESLQGVNFKVTEGEGDNAQEITISEATDENGKLTVVSNKEITSDNVGTKDVYTITEVSLNDNPYIAIKTPLTVYVTKEKVDTTYQATKVSFEENSEVTSKEVLLQDGKTTVTVTASVENGVVKVTIPNKEVEGQYSLELLKTGENDEPLQGVNFKVTEGEGNNAQEITISEATDENGKLTVVSNKEITSDNVGTKDVYTITEVSLNDNPYIAIKTPLTVYVTKEKVDTTYQATKVSFEENSEVTSKEVLLQDEKTTVTVTASVENGVVKVTVPNKKVEGSYGLEILKEDENGNPLEGVTFKVNNSKECGPSDTNGKVTVFSNKEITSETVNTIDKYTIEEVSTNGVVSINAGDYVVLENALEIYVKKELVSEYAYKATGVSFEENSEVTSKEVLLQDGKTTVTITASVENGVVKVTVPNKKVEGSYGLEILKEDENGNPLEGVTFKVNNSKEYGPSDTNGKVTVFSNKEITSETVNTIDKYTIEEVSTNGVVSINAGDYVVLENAVEIYVKKDIVRNENEYAYKAVEVSFEENGTTSTEAIKENVKLKDGTTVTLTASVENGVVKVTVLNKIVEGKYDFELIKVDQKDGKTPLPGVTFDITVKKDGEEVKLIDATTGEEIKTTSLTTDEEGKIVLSNIKITERASYTYEITETEVPEGYVMLKDQIMVELKTIIDNFEYVASETEISGVAQLEADKNKITVKVQNGQFDLALRKFITGVTTGVGTDEEKKLEVPDRVPVFKIDEDGNYVYEHSKEPVIVGNQNVVEYTLRVYNEGSIAGYASEIKDDIPEGLEFLPDDETNKKYGWILLDEEGNVTEDVNKAKYITTNYLSKDNEETEGENLIKAFNTEDYEQGNVTEPDYKEVKVAFKVTMSNTEDNIIINKAQISEDTDEDGNDVTDKDSTPDEWNEEDDDQDIEKVKVQYFDLSLRKWVTKAIVIEDGKETVTETGHTAEDDPEEVVKVDIQKSRLGKVVVKFEYKIRVTNEGEIAGFAKEISDYIPEGLRFEAADNPLWEESEGRVTTDQIKDVLLQPGETAEVSIILTWINRTDNMGLKENIAEISKDYNEYGSPDIDSTPNNQVAKEDDIDDAPVMLTVKTGQEVIIYIGMIMTVLAMLGIGIVAIKKYVLE